VRPAVYIPNYNGEKRIGRALEGMRGQSREIEVVVVDNGSTDASPELVRDEFPEVALIELGENLGFGPALNRAIAADEDADPVILLNDDAEPEPRFVEAMLEAVGEGVQAVAGVLVQERSPGLIDSAGVIADSTLMGFDYLNGEPLSAALDAADPLGPTGGAALYRRAAFDAVGGFDERIFLYYEDLDLALRLAAAGGRCRLAGEARALHAYSASLGAASARKYAATGWSRGYMLRRYGVMASPRLALRALACESALCAGQILRDRTAAGLGGRIQGWRDAAGLERRKVGAAELQDLGMREALALRRRRRGDSGASETSRASANLPPQVDDRDEQKAADGPSGPAELPPIRFASRAELAAGHLSGDGLEIGALHSPTRVPEGARSRFVDRKPASELRKEYTELAELDLIEVDVVDDGEVLGTIVDESQAFIIANHFLEHCEDPIGTIGTHLRKLQPGGVLFYTVPDKRYTFDFRRPLTPLEHMIADHELGPERSRRGHYEEWTTLTLDPPVEGREVFERWAAEHARELEDEAASIHMHVWTQAEFLQLILHCRSRFDEAFDIEAAVRIAGEFVVVLRKQDD
jgi:GT2 family glycosyltransferase